MTNGTWSYELERNIGFGLLSVDCEVGDAVVVHRACETVAGRLVEIPFRREDR